MYIWHTVNWYGQWNNVQPGGSAGKESTCNVGDLGLISGLGRCPGKGKGYSLQYSYLGNPMDRGAWWAIAHGVSKRVNQDLATKEHLKVKVVHWCLSFCNPIDYTVHEILQARIPEWVGFPFSRWSSQSGDRTQVSHIACGFFTSWTTREAQEYWSG